MCRQIVEIVSVCRERVLARPAFGGEHVEKQFDQRFVGCFWPPAHRIALSLASVIFDELVRWNGHDDLAWLVRDKVGKREHRAVAQPDEQTEEHQKSKQTWHGSIQRELVHRRPAIRASYGHVSKTADKTARGCRDYWYMEPWIRFGT